MTVARLDFLRRRTPRKDLINSAPAETRTATARRRRQRAERTGRPVMLSAATAHQQEMLYASQHCSLLS